MFFRLLSEYMAWSYKNKKSLEEGLQSTKDCKKIVEEKIAKEAKITEEQKK